MWRTLAFVVYFIQIFSQLCHSSVTTRRKRTTNDLAVSLPPTVPEEFSAQLRMQIQRGTSLETFLSSVQKDGQPLSINDVYPFESADNTTNGEKAYISGGARLAFPDECSPRPMSITIPRSPNDPARYIYWPECTMIERCGGCCPSDKLACVPDETEMAEYHVLRADVREQGSLYLEWAGPLAVAIERHLSCRIVCKLNPLDCEPYQRFIPEECTCICNYRMECTQAQIWDSDYCECKCPDYTRYHDCPRNTVFDEFRCRCVISEEAQEANIAIDLGHSFINPDLNPHNNPLYNNRINQVAEATPSTTPPTTTTPTTTPTTTTTATTTTTTRPATVDVCRHTRCPGRWVSIQRNGRCLCSPR